MSRNTTVIEATQAGPLSVEDMKADDIFQVKGYGDWWRCDTVIDGLISSLTDGTVRRGAGADEVTRVLAPGESLVIGPKQ